MADAERRYRALFELLPLGLRRCDADGRITFSTSALARIYGSSCEELVGGYVWDFVVTDDLREECRREFAFLLEHETEPRPHFGKSITKDGHPIDVRVDWTYDRNESGQVIGFLSSISDVTEKRRTEAELSDSVRRNADLVQALGEIVYDCHPKTGELRWDGDFSRILGYSSAEIGENAQSWLGRVHPDDLERVLAELETARVEARPFDLEYRFQCRDRSFRWMHDRGVVRLDEKGDLERIIGVFRDITQRKRAEQELEQRVHRRTRELLEKNAELDAFAHTVSHDLREPIRAMRGFAIALAEDYGSRLDEVGRGYIRQIGDSAAVMDKLVCELLAYSRLAHEQLRISPVDLIGVLKEAICQLQPEIRARRARLEIALEIPFVLGHRSTLVQVVSNLLSNALKFVAPGVRPEIRIWTQSVQKNRIRLSISDNGIGLRKKDQERIFGPLERLHGIESYPGTGLGLAIVARACKRLGGACGVRSSPGKGSLFWIEFPKG